ncbi:hypothetical protein MAR_014041 [Mya arenaria]|uniref:Uncharacterized protein n=1 Tax=Mya arenaria TaxID=6604 RepID=A0ABY7G350_MYAAR|nr:hypothetical protein MAR_014041 [Mya arenaria]
MDLLQQNEAAMDKLLKASENENGKTLKKMERDAIRDILKKSFEKSPMGRGLNWVSSINTYDESELERDGTVTLMTVLEKEKENISDIELISGDECVAQFGEMSHNEQKIKKKDAEETRGWRNNPR